MPRLPLFTLRSAAALLPLLTLLSCQFQPGADWDAADTGQDAMIDAQERSARVIERHRSHQDQGGRAVLAAASCTLNSDCNDGRSCTNGLCGKAWSIRAETGPSARTTALAYDSIRNRTVLFGGHLGLGVMADDTWEWDGATWTQRIVPGPSARRGHAMAYDSARGVTVLFGGYDINTFNGETWEWNGSTWQLVATTGPTPRWDHAMAYDAVRGVTVLFGGAEFGGTRRSDTWEWDGVTWTQRASGGPLARQEHNLIYDEYRGVTVLFGGDSGTLRGDTWEWNGVSWSQVATTGPSARKSASMIYDRSRRVTVLFGGSAPTLMDDTWEWDGTNWQQVAVAGPGARLYVAAAYDSQRGVGVFFGGGAFPFEADTWEWAGALGICGFVDNGTCGAAYDPCSGRNPGDPCDSCHPEDTTCTEPMWTCNDSLRCVEPLGNDLCLSDADCPHSHRCDGGECWPWLPMVSAGYRHACALGFDGQMACWGDNFHGQSTALPGTYRYVGAGSLGSNCAVSDARTVTCWGQNTSGQLASTVERVIDVGEGYTHHCAVTSGGELTCWGNNDFGKVTGAPAGDQFVQVGAGRDHSCALNRSGAVVCWGSNAQNQVSTVPAGPFKALSVGNYHACALRDAGTVACWGSNASGQTNVPLLGMYTYRSVSAGASHTCALQSNDEIACWGSSLSGESTPPPGTFRSVSAGTAFTCGVRTSGQITCWGDNGFGQSAPPPLPACTTDVHCDDGDSCTNDSCGTGWTVGATTGPFGRVATHLAYDPDRMVVTLFGGQDATTARYGDTWEWNGTTWTPRAGGPPARSGAGFAYDRLRGEAVLVGGSGEGGALGDTWVWDGLSWTERPVAGPPARSSTRMVYDRARGRMVLFGGQSGIGTFLNDTWEWNGTSWTQRVVAGPAMRSNHGMVYDTHRNVVVLFGGAAGATLYNDTWEWNGTTWTQRVVTGPSPRRGHGMAYDTTRRVTVLFGGVDEMNRFDDVWEWNGVSWTQITGDGPESRNGARLVYDEARGKTLMFGGLADGAVMPADTWLFGGPAGTCIHLDNGTCLLDCVQDFECPGVQNCYAGQCLDDACEGVVCGPGLTCYGGSCFPECTEDEHCDPNHVCYDGRCGPIADSCQGVTCSASQACFGGTCFQACTEDDQCDPNHVCYEGRCVREVCNGDDCEPDYCDQVQCGTEWTCFWGTCFPQCDSTSCNPGAACYSGRCTDNPCEGVNCPAGKTCYQGSCFPICSDDDDCDPDSYCYNGRCAPTACHGVDCRVGQACYQGSCFVECDADTTCAAVDDRCYNQRCSADPCDGVQCRIGFACVEGRCLEPCGANGACPDLHYCYQGHCAQEECSIPEHVRCHAEQLCYRGTCFYGCEEDDHCDPNHFCYDGRCATDSCAAMIEDYDGPHHHYRRMNDRWPTLVQRSLPWRRPRPASYSGPVADAMAAMLTGSLPEASRARVVLYFDEDNERYALLLLQGVNGAGQEPLGATYAVRYFDLPSAPAVRWRTPNAQVHAVSREGDFYYQEISIRSDGGALSGAGAVLLGYFPAREQWTLRLSAAFWEGIDAWEFFSAESGHWLELDPREELELTNAEMSSDVVLTEEVGVWECKPRSSAGTDSKGICSRGTVNSCRYFSLQCIQTVSPWAYESCDGRDNTCDGVVDNVEAASTTTLAVPMVFIRQGGEDKPWLRAPTIDATRTAFESLNYSPRLAATFGDGSAAMTPVGASDELQAGHRSLVAFHRDLKNHVLTFPLLHGARVVGSFPDSANVEARILFANELDSAFYDYSDLMFSAWHDDWNDDGISAINEDEIDLSWQVRKSNVAGADGREADSTLLQILWQNGASLKPLRFDLQMISLPESLNQWRYYRPYTALHLLNASLPLQVKIEWVPLAESACMSATAFDGCRMVPYVCSGGQLLCPDATAANCVGCRDRDQDGFLGYDRILCPEGDDCDDTRPEVNPSAIEACDGMDTNCDGYIDGIGPSALYESCPDGSDLCGPAECNYRPICACDQNGCECQTRLME
jgi:hypothetical protein